MVAKQLWFDESARRRLDDNGKRVALDLAVGDRILYAKYTGTDVKIDNVDYIVLNEKDVLCKLEV